MKNLKCMVTALAPAILIAFCSCSSEPKSETAPQSEYAPSEPAAKAIAETNQARGAVILNAITATATVQSVDAFTRTVVLQREDGTQLTCECGPEVRNFKRIEVGDKVKVTLAEELALVLVKGEMLPAAGRTTVLVRSQPGAKPGGKMVDTVAISARVMAVDASARTVTLLLPDGQNKTVTVGPDVRLENVNVGDHVGVQLTQALIITVKKP